ncbi:MAG TPA: VOC family protein [Roseiflexaceae bacterium]
MRARYVHTNVIAHDWRGLAAFYCAVFGCTPVPPERDYAGADLDAGTGLRNAHLRGAHLRLPGCRDAGPTIEIYSYDELETRPATAVNRPGFGHIAFDVDDVEQARHMVLRDRSRGEYHRASGLVGLNKTQNHSAVQLFKAQVAGRRSRAMRPATCDLL